MRLFPRHFSAATLFGCLTSRHPDSSIMHSKIAQSEFTVTTKQKFYSKRGILRMFCNAYNQLP